MAVVVAILQTVNWTEIVSRVKSILQGWFNNGWKEFLVRDLIAIAVSLTVGCIALATAFWAGLLSYIVVSVSALTLLILLFWHGLETNS